MDKIQKNALSELVYVRIKQMILDGALVPGDRLSKKDLATTMGVSQTPVNEAVIRLSGEGLLEPRGRGGIHVRVFTYQDLRDLFAVRAGLEGIALRLCIEQLPREQLDKLTHHFDGFTLPMNDAAKALYMKADQAFHEELISLSGNSFIIGYDRGFDFIMKSYQKGLIREPEETLVEHQEIIRAIRSRDAQLGQELLIRHHVRTRAFIEDKYLRTQQAEDG
jgi:DNA-binding GntR family transcriptional regulator